MVVERIVVGPLQTNCYLVYNEGAKDALLIDPGFHPEQIMARVKSAGVRVVAILLTHGHYDHAFAAKAVKEETGAQLFLHVADAALWEQGGAIRRYVFPPKDEELIRASFVRPDRYILHEETLLLAGISVTFRPSPGHTAGSMLLLTDEAVFTGDTLMRGTVGRTDFPESNPFAMEETLREIVKPLSPALKVYPGHGEPSDMARELEFNPFLEQI